MPTDGQGLRGRPQASGLLGEIGSKVVVTLSDGRNQGVSLFEGHRAIKHHSRRRLSRKIDRGYFDLLPEYTPGGRDPGRSTPDGRPALGLRPGLAAPRVAGSRRLNLLNGERPYDGTRYIHRGPGK